jgi:hypothetical protein
MRHLRDSSPLLPLLLVVACAEPAVIEGGLQDAECSDGLDNDNNGQTDCEELACEDALACKFPVETDTGGEDTAQTGVQILELSYGTDDVRYRFDVTLGGTGTLLSLHLINLTAEDNWTERHPFPQTPSETAEDASWERHSMELDCNRGEGFMTPGKSTFFTCDERDALTYTLFLTDLNLNRLGCVVWGADPAGANERFNTDCGVFTDL